MAQLIGSPACCSAQEAVAYGVTNYIDALVTETGKTPGLIFGNYLEYNLAIPGTPVDYGTLNDALIGYAEDGSLVGVNYLPNNPWNGGFVSNLDEYGSLSELVDTESDVYSDWMVQLSAAADGLEELQTAGVTVLLRPIPEMNGTWFWWNVSRPTQAQFAAVWQQIFTYFTTTRALHNLLWVYAPSSNSPRLSSGVYAEPVGLYPGSDYVDIVGVDDYSERALFWNYGEMLDLGKPICFGEKGPPTATAASTSLTYETLGGIIAQSYPNLIFSQSWIHPFALAVNTGGPELLEDPMVATQEDVIRAMTALETAVTTEEKLAAVLL